jgi:glucose-1-phosphate cytidylyltransferase
MKLYSHYGFNDFIICCGYKAYAIKEYFANYFLHHSDVTFDFTSGKNEISIHNNATEPWKVTLVDTGLHTMTGGRVRRIRDYVGNEPFMLTYGDGVSDVDISDLLRAHQASGKLATLTAYQPNNRFGVLDIDQDDSIRDFREKTRADGDWINAGFMVLEPAVFDYISGDSTVLEREPLEQIARSGRLNAYKHEGFWQCMDTLRDKQLLEKLWAENAAPWKVW